MFSLIFMEGSTFSDLSSTIFAAIAQSIAHKSTKAIQWEKESVSKNNAKSTGYSYAKNEL